MLFPAFPFPPMYDGDCCCWGFARFVGVVVAVEMVDIDDEDSEE